MVAQYLAAGVAPASTPLSRAVATPPNEEERPLLGVVDFSSSPRSPSSTPRSPSNEARAMRVCPLGVIKLAKAAKRATATAVSRFSRFFRADAELTAQAEQFINPVKAKLALEKMSALGVVTSYDPTHENKSQSALDSIFEQRACWLVLVAEKYTEDAVSELRHQGYGFFSRSVVSATKAAIKAAAISSIQSYEQEVASALEGRDYGVGKQAKNWIQTKLIDAAKGHGSLEEAKENGTNSEAYPDLIEASKLLPSVTFVPFNEKPHGS